MIHGLLWLPLLIFFFWITWAGRNEYQKVEAYQQWATQFDRAKYDILSALGQTERSLTWGLPTPKGVVNLQTVKLDDIRSIALCTKGDSNFAELVQPDTKKSEAFLQLKLQNGAPCQIPFTDATLATQWHGFLEKTLAGEPV